MSKPTRKNPPHWTDAFVKGLKAGDKPYKLSEQALKGDGRLVVRVLPNGTKEFFYRYRTEGQDKTLALGRYDHTGRRGRTLAELGRQADEVRRLQRETGDVKRHLADERLRKDVEGRKGTLRQLCAAYVQSLRDAGKVSADEAEGVFRLYVVGGKLKKGKIVPAPFPDLASKKASDIEPGDIQRVLGKMVRAGIKRQVNVTRSYLRAAFAYGAKADHDPRTVAKEGVLFGLKSNPVVQVPKIGEYERTGDRVLSEEELRHYWKGLETLPAVQRATLRFNLALACQRPTQLLRAGWEHFDLEQNTLLLADSKGRGASRDHLLPLTSFALEQLKPLRKMNELPGEEEGEPAPPPFSSDGKRPMVVETLSNAVAEVASDLKKEKEIAKFDQRDLRRTAETMLQKLGIDKEVRAHLLSHGRSKGIQGKHYERYDFLKEKRTALEKWARHLDRVTSGKTAKVVRIKAA